MHHEGKVRIVVWNCRMALGKKRELLYDLKPDLAVVPECSEDSARLCREDGYGSYWCGSNKHKGLAVFAAKPWSLEPGLRPTQKWIAAVKVNGPTNFLLIAVWACSVGGIRELNYIGQVFEAIRRHPAWFKVERPVVLCGDLNSNAIFDHGRKTRNHTAVVGLLEERNLLSAYHTFFSEEHGKETKPTYYFLHQRTKPFHLDYVFLPRQWIRSITNVTVGSYEKWRSASDHAPLIVEVSIKYQGKIDANSHPMKPW
jgi:exodeoxyribonuclease-3